jgi:acyl-CoA reductase-like NAD-dependent aldehyde dehydrogenase
VKRAKLLYRLADAVEANADDIAWLESLASLANDTQYGLAAKIWTRDLRSAHQPARKLQAGWITINGGREGALSFTEIKSISVGY